jgi:hypothetical protein
MIRQLLLGSALCLGLTVAAQAATAPFALFLFSPTQTTQPGDSVSGIRLGLIYGVNASLTGIDAGGVNRLTSSLSGLQWSVWGTVEGDLTGAQQNLICAQAKGHALGLQSALYSQAGSLTGIQFGVVNLSGRTEGIQIGLVNMADSMKGLQIGLVNAIRSGGAFPVFPIVNWSF